MVIEGLFLPGYKNQVWKLLGGLLYLNYFTLCYTWDTGSVPKNTTEYAMKKGMWFGTKPLMSSG